jgi:hypothetical protein
MIPPTVGSDIAAIRERRCRRREEAAAATDATATTPNETDA